MADKNLDGNGLSEVWVRAAQLVKKYTGAVDSTKGDLQTQVNEKLSGTDDTKDNVITFTSADETNPTAWKNVNVLSSKEKHLSLLNKISTMFSNVRYLYKILGTTDISALGTVTQAIATLNGNVGSIKGISSSAAITTQGEYALDAREKNASVDGTLANQISVLNGNLDTFKNKTSIESYDFNTSLDVESDEYTALHTGWAMIYYRFKVEQYSQFGLTLNNANVIGANISCNESKLGGSGVIPLYLQKGDKIRIGYYSTFRMEKVTLRIRY